jgi:hypothetical protein
MPIISFDRPVTNKDQVDRALHPNQQVTLIAHLDGRTAAKDLNGTQHTTVRFRSATPTSAGSTPTPTARWS